MEFSVDQLFADGLRLHGPAASGRSPLRVSVAAEDGVDGEQTAEESSPSVVALTVSELWELSEDLWKQGRGARGGWHCSDSSEVHMLYANADFLNSHPDNKAGRKYCAEDLGPAMGGPLGNVSASAIKRAIYKKISGPALHLSGIPSFRFLDLVSSEYGILPENADVFGFFGHGPGQGASCPDFVLTRLRLFFPDAEDPGKRFCDVNCGGHEWFLRPRYEMLQRFCESLDIIDTSDRSANKKTVEDGATREAAKHADIICLRNICVQAVGGGGRFARALEAPDAPSRGFKRGGEGVLDSAQAAIWSEIESGRARLWRNPWTNYSRCTDGRLFSDEQWTWVLFAEELARRVYTCDAAQGKFKTAGRVAVLGDVARYIAARHGKAMSTPRKAGNNSAFSVSAASSSLSITLEGTRVPLLKMLLLFARRDYSAAADYAAVLHEFPWDFGATIDGDAKGRSVFADLAVDCDAAHAGKIVSDILAVRFDAEKHLPGYRGKAEIRLHQPGHFADDKPTRIPFSEFTRSSTKKDVPQADEECLRVDVSWACDPSRVRELASKTDLAGLSAVEIAVLHRNIYALQWLLGSQHHKSRVSPPLVEVAELQKKIGDGLSRERRKPDLSDKGKQASSAEQQQHQCREFTSDVATTTLAHWSYVQSLTAFQLACHVGEHNAVSAFFSSCYNRSFDMPGGGGSFGHPMVLRSAEGQGQLTGFSKSVLLQQRDSFGRSPLHLACCVAHGRGNETASEILAAEMEPGEVDALDSFGRSALMYVARNGITETFCAMLRRCPSVDINQKDPATGNTPFLLLLHGRNARPLWNEEVDKMDEALYAHFWGPELWKDPNSRRHAFDDPVSEQQFYDPTAESTDCCYVTAVQLIWHLLQKHGVDLAAKNNKGEDWLAVASKNLSEDYVRAFEKAIEGNSFSSDEDSEDDSSSYISS
ncbi:unnamed protein product [Amoebophrya sp. A25]|nr:unnamed protein product [Amoebophrya sp. A25]|eukprot:GSA25T00004168001.1